jgi:hypothetical protein
MNSRMAKLAVLSAAIWLLAACQDGTAPAGAAVGSVTILTQSAMVQRSEPIVVAMTNSGPSEIVFNECPTFVEHFSGRDWHPVPREDWFPGTGCERLLRLLPVGGTFSFEIRIPPTAPPGTYRVRLRSLWDKGDVGIYGPQLPDARLISNSFSIIAGAHD